ncbi:hypothetical protein FOA52_004153 [Chlamydomonas sp. UWO 241]|nr:hypothetical protein FOA52_004153 [Chlamydomonas sp. UWO 241]
MDKLLSGCAMFVSSIGSKYVQKDLTLYHEHVLQQPAVKKFVLFCTCYVYTSDVMASLIMVVLISVLVDLILNEHSIYCVLPTHIRAPLIVYLLATAAVMAFIMWDMHKKHGAVLKTIDEIKGKIGSLVRDVNAHQRQDFAVNMAQTAAINDLKKT